MRIKNRKLTIIDNSSTGVASCAAACDVELNALETAALANPFHPGFKLFCRLEAVDPDGSGTVFTYPDVKTLNLLSPVIPTQTFNASISTELLDEDAGGTDEIRAAFTLIDKSNNASVTKKSDIIKRAF